MFIRGEHEPLAIINKQFHYLKPKKPKDLSNTQVLKFGTQFRFGSKNIRFKNLK